MLPSRCADAPCYGCSPSAQSGVPFINVVRLAVVPFKNVVRLALLALIGRLDNWLELKLSAANSFNSQTDFGRTDNSFLLKFNIVKFINLSIELGRADN